ncbi:metal ABC transporter ATP-binding protein [Dickeya solani]|uniref:ABC transporter ATP-binding protein n=1 Tax=Dickeya solani TaxID=1089444 RepID=A0ABU4EIX7_9GAMM|nr:ABC transporter ATP-binding protein [Dickeya solani]MCA7000288.1 ABC transporter ATP-binding protein [Dickeya solani]MCZ0820227.1 ABC transporter ATP-binding protein [Dickeya solani]MDV6994477.1 ABC transporter ATP-binding protein [Dickeya solani]MDV7005877.1 ABC transporter ATP-binding protein [Dickeya solani]MDV7038310.1 ABC transporter ATP-binding protein [Dickeya solani]
MLYYNYNKGEYCDQSLRFFRCCPARYRRGFASAVMGFDFLGGDAGMTAPYMIALHTLMFGYPGQPPLGTLDGCFDSGSLTAIVGANGTGKSTLLKTLAGLLPPLGGHFCMAPQARRQLGYLPQLAEFDRQFPLSVNDLVLMGCVPHCGMFGRISGAWRKKAHDALDTVGMAEFALTHIGTLSGGQLQRVLFARLLVMQSPVILLDEPFTGIDAQTTRTLLTVIRQLHQEGRTILTVLHDLEQVETHFPRVLMLRPEGHRWGDCREVLSSTPAVTTPPQLRVVP